MNYKLTIHCTEKHLKKAKWCGIKSGKSISENCWIALAVQEIFPLVDVFTFKIENFHRYENGVDKQLWSIPLPSKAKQEIATFDSKKTVEERMKLEPFSFTVNIPQDTLDIIMQCNRLRNMQELNEIVFRTPHLELVEAPQMS